MALLFAMDPLHEIPSRPYLIIRTTELAKLAQIHWSDGAGLTVIANELASRTTRKARKLERGLRQRLAELEPPDTSLPPCCKGRDDRIKQLQLKLANVGKKLVYVENRLAETRARMEFAEAMVGQVDVLRDRISELERDLRLADAALRRAQHRARLAEERIAEERIEKERAAEADDRADSYAAVGLIPTCPDFVFDAVRRAFLMRYHPDSSSSATERVRMSCAEQFKRFYSLFQQLNQTRHG